mmetsp:Transcript_84745/g.168299  ORF Transcript_84745/g.168299 Transcript_84745/m.168299 type:complete len:219 (-) Transcript_84745:1170-1826(-)
MRSPSVKRSHLAPLASKLLSARPLAQAPVRMPFASSKQRPCRQSFEVMLAIRCTCCRPHSSRSCSTVSKMARHCLTAWKLAWTSSWASRRSLDPETMSASAWQVLMHTSGAEIRRQPTSTALRQSSSVWPKVGRSWSSTALRAMAIVSSALAAMPVLLLPPNAQMRNSSNWIWPSPLVSATATTLSTTSSVHTPASRCFSTAASSARSMTPSPFLSNI